MTPRKVFIVGHCGGGAAATVTALWMALQCPTADVRCITFGSPKVGNAAFTEVFRQAFQDIGLAQSAGHRRLLLSASSHVQHTSQGVCTCERQLQALCQGLLACLDAATLQHTAACRSPDLPVSGGYGFTDTL